MKYLLDTHVLNWFLTDNKKKFSVKCGGFFYLQEKFSVLKFEKFF